MIRLNFFSDEKSVLLSKFCNYFNLPEYDVLIYIHKNLNTVTPNLFVSRFNLNLNDYDYTKIEIAGRHITTIADEDFNEFRKHGLLGLKSVLEQQTPLSNFLLRNDVQVNVKKKVLIVKDIEIPIERYNEFATKEKPDYVNDFCKFSDGMNSLHNDLYYWKGVLNFFINIDTHEIIKYSCLYRHPEILLALDNILESLAMNHRKNLCALWKSRNPQPYILEFYTPLSKLYIPNLSWCNLIEEQCQECLVASNYDYEDLEQKNISRIVLANTRLLKWFFSIYKDNSDYDSWLLPNKKIPPSKIVSIIKV